MFYPYLLGEYDGLAEALSMMMQVFGVVGMLLVPIGVFWVVYELRRKKRAKVNLPHTDTGYYFAIASLIVASFVALVVTIFAWLSTGLSFGLLTLALWVYLVARLIPRLKLLKNVENRSFNPAPLYLFIPIAALVVQLMFAVPAIEFSRNNAIAMSAEMINEIENYHRAYGSYPLSLNALNKDYHTSVVGIEQYHYAPNGDAYNLYFNQPRFLFPELGAREVVMYNKLDQHIMPSHAYWVLISTPEELAEGQGWYAVHDASTPHWKYFWFD
jgi:hypothetical protein